LNSNKKVQHSKKRGKMLDLGRTAILLSKRRKYSKKDIVPPRISSPSKNGKAATAKIEKKNEKRMRPDDRTGPKESKRKKKNLSTPRAAGGLLDAGSSRNRIRVAIAALQKKRAEKKRGNMPPGWSTEQPRREEREKEDEISRHLSLLGRRRRREKKVKGEKANRPVKLIRAQSRHSG